VWAQNQNQDAGGKWSWHDARKYFYEGLTSVNKAARDASFAKTFRALGQLMHLIQDASVPSHTRNDIHVIYNYEDWVEDVRNNWSGKYNNWISTPKTYDRSILDLPSNPLAPIPIAKIIDTDKYTKDNQDIESTKSLAIGLAEYSNGNFFSEDTSFVGWYPFPNWVCVETVPYQIVDPKDPLRTVSRQYYKKDTIVGCGETNEGKGYRLATVGFLKDYVLTYFPKWVTILRALEKPALDANVYGDYASLLIPRAVGYSSGLLEYFFRGRLQVTAVPIFYKNAIEYLRVKIKNITPTKELMTNGQFTLAYSYRPTGGKPDGSQDIWDQAPVAPSGTLQYGGDEQDPIEDTVIDFWLPTPIPRENYDSAKFTLAFKGKLGNEEGAVIGKALTLGEIKFEEEWNNGLTGNYTWAHTDINLFDQNPDNGTTTNIVEGDTLIKDNIRYAGKRSARANDSFLSTRYNNGQFKGNLPIKITPDTYLEFKIDEMWINERTPAPSGYTNDWQYLMLSFNNGLGVQFSTQEQGLYLGPKVGTFEFNPNLIAVGNIYQLFKIVEIPIPAGDIYLEEISFVQQLNILDDPSIIEHHQRMKIDSIRIIEGKQQ